VDPHRGPPVALVPHGGHVLHVAADAVFRAEKGGKPHAPRFMEQVCGMAQAPVHCRRVADEPHRKPPQGDEPFFGEHVEAGCNLPGTARVDQDLINHRWGEHRISRSFLSSWPNSGRMVFPSLMKISDSSNGSPPILKRV
jgi:hypothetical protein